MPCFYIYTKLLQAGINTNDTLYEMGFLKDELGLERSDAAV